MSLEVFPAFQEWRGVGLLWELSRRSQHHSGWLPLRLAEGFLTSPSCASLASVVDEIADKAWDARQHWQGCLPFLPWPLANCLDAVNNVVELRELSGQIRAGMFGNATNWKATEQRWASEGIPLELLRDIPAAGVSLNDRGHLGLPRRLARVITNKGFSASIRRELLRAGQDAKSEVAGRAIVGFWTGSGAVDLAEIQPGEFQKLCDRYGAWLWEYINPAGAALTDRWLEALDAIGRGEGLHGGRARAGAVEWGERFQSALLDSHTKQLPLRVGLLRLLSRIAARGIAVNHLRSEMLEVDSGLMDPRFRLAAGLVRLSQPTLTTEDAGRLADEAAAVLADPLAEKEAFELILETAQEHLDRVPAIGPFLLRLREKLPPGIELGVARCDQLLRSALRNRVSELHGQLQKLQLPFVSDA